MAHHATTPRVIPPTDVIKVGQWSIQVWSRIIGNNAARFTAIATNSQGTQLTAYGLTHAMALDNIVKQLPEEPNP
jgi:hypothetical protein